MLCEWFWNIKALFYEEKKSPEKKESRKLLKDKERLKICDSFWYYIINDKCALKLICENGTGDQSVSSVYRRKTFTHQNFIDFMETF